MENLVGQSVTVETPVEKVFGWVLFYEGHQIVLECQGPEDDEGNDTVIIRNIVSEEMIVTVIE